MTDKDDFRAYLAEARSWETDRAKQMARSRKTAWRIAAASSAIAFMSVVAVAMLTPLKSVEPFVIRVDNATGIVDVVSGLADGKPNYEESVNKYFTQWYVRYREGYSKELAEEYYKNVGLMSGSLEQQKYHEIFNPKNPQSPLNVYGDYARVKIRIKSTSFISPTIALVRYTRAIERGPDKPSLSHWAATITFRYSKAPMSVEDRGINPLGFQVTEYRNDPDSDVSGTDSSKPPASQKPGLEAGVLIHPVQPSPANRPLVPAIQP